MTPESLRTTNRARATAQEASGPAQAPRVTRTIRARWHHRDGETEPERTAGPPDELAIWHHRDEPASAADTRPPDETYAGRDAAAAWSSR